MVAPLVTVLLTEWKQEYNMSNGTLLYAPDNQRAAGGHDIVCWLGGYSLINNVEPVDEDDLIQAQELCKVEKRADQGKCSLGESKNLELGYIERKSSMPLTARTKELKTMVESQGFDSLVKNVADVVHQMTH